MLNAFCMSFCWEIKGSIFKFSTILRIKNELSKFLMIFFVFSFSSLFLFSHGFLMRCFVELALRQFKVVRSCFDKAPYRSCHRCGVWRWTHHPPCLPLGYTLNNFIWEVSRKSLYLHCENNTEIERFRNPVQTPHDKAYKTLWKTPCGVGARFPCAIAATQAHG